MQIKCTKKQQQNQQQQQKTTTTTKKTHTQTQKPKQYKTNKQNILVRKQLCFVHMSQHKV
jgi:hypothetical protein